VNEISMEGSEIANIEPVQKKKTLKDIKDPFPQESGLIKKSNSANLLRTFILNKKKKKNH
jgi:hypothetical protein